MKRLFRDPLTHFVLLGGLIFVAYQMLGENDVADPKTVVVDRSALVSFVQYRSRAFQPRVAAARLDGLNEQELRTLIDDYVREEVLHREARAMRLDENDYVIRRRLVQKVEFIAEGFAGSAPPIAEEALRAYFEENAADYYSAAAVTFTHVFLDAKRRGWHGARTTALETLRTLRADAAGFSDSTRYGDRFLYHVNYVERELDVVASHFGATMAQSLFVLPASEDEWQGPFESPYGVHLVLLTRSSPGRSPALDEVRLRVTDDAERRRLRVLQEQALESIIESYDVRIDYQPEAEVIARSENR